MPVFQGSREEFLRWHKGEHGCSVRIGDHRFAVDLILVVAGDLVHAGRWRCSCDPGRSTIGEPFCVALISGLHAGKHFGHRIGGAFAQIQVQHFIGDRKGDVGLAVGQGDHGQVLLRHHGMVQDETGKTAAMGDDLGAMPVLGEPAERSAIVMFARGGLIRTDRKAKVWRG